MAGVFGIHVGNSSACLAYFKDGKIDVIADNSGNRLMPAVVGFLDGEEYVGLPAKTAIPRNAVSTVVKNKNLLNDSILDHELEDHMKSVRCKIVTEGGPKYEISDSDKIIVCTPEDILISVYKKLHEIASTCVPVGSDLHVVLCVPLHFSQCSRQLLAHAAEDVGFDVLQVISEPAAALLAHEVGLGKPSETMTCLVYRLGGATLDIAVMLCCAGMYTVKSHVHKSDVGGDEFTNMLADFHGTIFHQKWKLDPSESRRAMAKLFLATEQSKHVLSTNSSAYCLIESLCDGTDFSYRVSRARFENLMTPTIKMFTEPIEEALKLAGVCAEDIDKVILCGGSVKIPLLKKTISEIFSKSELLCNANPDEIIAVGAAKHGGFLIERFDPDCEHLSYEMPVITKPIYMKALGKFEVLVPALTPVPVKVTRTLVATEAESGITVQVIESDEDRDVGIDECSVQLGTLNLTDAKPNAEVVVEVIVNSIGGLNASITNMETHSRNSFKLSPPETEISEDCIN